MTLLYDVLEEHTKVIANLLSVECDFSFDTFYTEAEQVHRDSDDSVTIRPSTFKTGPCKDVTSRSRTQRRIRVSVAQQCILTHDKADVISSTLLTGVNNCPSNIHVLNFEQ